MQQLVAGAAEFSHIVACALCEAPLAKASGVRPEWSCPVNSHHNAPPLLAALPRLCLAQIIASDGVWDVMDPREAANRVMDVVSAGGSAEEAARQLVQDTVMLAECSPDGDADNTTACVVVFD